MEIFSSNGLSFCKLFTTENSFWSWVVLGNLLLKGIASRLSYVYHLLTSFFHVHANAQSSPSYFSHVWIKKGEKSIWLGLSGQFDCTVSNKNKILNCFYFSYNFQNPWVVAFKSLEFWQVWLFKMPQTQCSEFLQVIMKACFEGLGL